MDTPLLVQLIGTVGLPGALVIAFVVWGNAREKRLDARMQAQDHFIRNSLHQAAMNATLAIVESTKMQERVCAALQENSESMRDCIAVLARMTK